MDQHSRNGSGQREKLAWDSGPSTSSAGSSGSSKAGKALSLLEVIQPFYSHINWPLDVGHTGKELDLDKASLTATAGKERPLLYPRFVGLGLLVARFLDCGKGLSILIQNASDTQREGEAERKLWGQHVPTCNP